MASTAEMLVTVLGLLVAQNPPPQLMPGATQPTLGTGSFEPAPKTIKDLIERELGKPKFKIKRCKWPCERSA